MKNFPIKSLGLKSTNRSEITRRRTIKRSVKGVFSYGILLVIFVLIQGCSAGPIRAISADKKDSTGIYDGRWLATVTYTPPTKYWHQGTLRCGDRTGHDYPLIVEDGQIGFSFDENVVYIDSDGSFRISVPGGKVIKFNFSGSRAGDDRSTMIMTGSLKSKKGSVFWAIPALGGNGCSSKLSFEKL